MPRPALTLLLGVSRYVCPSLCTGLRLKLKTCPDEEKEGIEAEIKSRKSQAKKLRANGINPSPAISVFNQIDLDKGGTVSTAELKRVLYGLKKIFPQGEAEVESMIKTMDTDGTLHKQMHGRPSFLALGRVLF